MFNSISNYVAENPSSSFSRLFFSSENERSLQSNLDRTHSLEDGIKLIADNYFIYGPGTLNFASRWASFSDAHEPHNGLLFLLVQFGILGFIPIFILYLVGKRAYISQVFIFYLTFIIHFSLQPNEMYYGNMFLCLFYIDTKYYFLDNKYISLNN
jgi:O-antigen ligase